MASVISNAEWVLNRREVTLLIKTRDLSHFEYNLAYRFIAVVNSGDDDSLFEGDNSKKKMPIEEAYPTANEW